MIENVIPFKDPDTGKCGLKDRLGNVKMLPKYHNIGPFDGTCPSQFLARVSVKTDNGITITKKFGFINESGEEVIPAIYDDAGTFGCFGMASVTLNGESFKIDTRGRRI